LTCYLLPKYNQNCTRKLQITVSFILISGILFSGIHVVGHLRFRAFAFSGLSYSGIRVFWHSRFRVFTFSGIPYSGIRVSGIILSDIHVFGHSRFGHSSISCFRAFIFRGKCGPPLLHRSLQQKIKHILATKSLLSYF